MTFSQRHRWVLRSLAGFLLLVLVLQAVDGGVADPTAAHLSGSAAAFNSGLLVFREGLESVLVLAAITAGMLGANRGLRHPIGIGVGVGLAGTWFATFPDVEGVTAEAAAAVFVLGSYFLAGELRVRRPLRRGEMPATVLTHEPDSRGAALRTT